MLFDFRLFFGLAFFINNSITRGYHYNCIRCYIPLHCVTSGQQSCFWDFRPTRSVYSPFLAYRPSQYLARVYPLTLLWIVQKYTFALYIDLDTSTSLLGWIILMNLDGRQQNSEVLRPCLFFVKCRWAACIIISGLKHGKLDIRLE